MSEHKQVNKANNGHMCVYISHLLSSAEKKYANIKHESLALTWASQKFKNFLLRMHFILETDHKPLVQIFKTEHPNDLSCMTLNMYECMHICISYYTACVCEPSITKRCKL